ncbi:MAG: DUF3891 family protein [Thermosynechococcaceae cyanobacterium]
MIVNMTEDGWEIIYHRAHALLAAQIAGQWPPAQAPRLYETIAAISHHDDLEREWDGDHLTEAGAPRDFQLDTSVSVERLTKLIEGARYRSRWVALLTSMHVCFLNSNSSDTSDKLKDFLKQQQHLQRHWRKEMDLSEQEVSQAYEFMRWCDRLSLILAQRQVPANGRSLEITSSIEGQRYDIKRLNDDQITVEPWPFAASKFVVRVEAQYLTTLKFDSAEDLKQALRENALTQDISWSLSQS